MFEITIADTEEHGRIHVYYDHETNCYTPVLDEHGDVIQSSVCICHALEATECCCGAWDEEDVIE